MQTNVIQGEEAIKGIMEGIKVAVDLIRPTYGGMASNVTVESTLRPFHGIYNDAWSIVKAIKITKGDAQRVGLNFVKELCERADKLSGDSRKTTLILLEEILKAGIESNVPKLQLKRELDELIPFIEREINKQTKQITVDEVVNVAQTASESEEIGKLLQEIYQKIGKNGNIQVEGSGTTLTSYREIDGVRFDMAGYLSTDFADPKTKKVTYENPLILVTKKKISNDDDINPLLVELMGMDEKRPLVIFTQDMDGDVASRLVGLHKSGLQKICIIAAPSLWRDYYFEDFAKCTGATIIEDSTGKNFRNMVLSDLGTCGKITIEADETILNGTTDITDHIAQLKAQGDDDSKLRLYWLNSKTAILKLGAGSETDLSYKLKKCNDAVKSSELALKYGIVSGAGFALRNIATTLPDNPAGRIMKTALEAPNKQIRLNMGLSQDGFDSTWFGENIVDASMVVKMAVRNAVGIASTILTSAPIVYIPEKTPLEMQWEIAMQKNTAF